jgi:prolyl oligopeptidase
MPIDDRPTLAAPDDDPYLWLEEIEGDRAVDFVERQSRLTLEKFGHAGFAGDRDTLAEIYDRPDNIPYVSRCGGFLYNFWKDANNPRGIWRRTTLEEFRNPDPKWDMLLDLDKLAKAEAEDWILRWGQALPGTNARMLSLSRGGSDAVVMREFDVANKAFVADGFTLPEAKGSAEWLDADTLLLSSAYGEDMSTVSGYARTVRLWRRGTGVDHALVIFETVSDSMQVYSSVDRSGATPRIWFIERLGFFDYNWWLGDENGAQTKLDLPTDIWMQAHRDWLAVKVRTAWSAGGQNHEPDTVIGISLSAFLAGDRDFEVLFEPAPRRALQGLFWTAGKLVLPILDELRPVFDLCTPSANGWTHSRLHGLPDIGVVNVWPLGPGRD